MIMWQKLINTRRKLLEYNGMAGHIVRNQLFHDFETVLATCHLKKPVVKTLTYILDESIVNVIDYYEANTDITNRIKVYIRKAGGKIFFRIESYIKPTDLVALDEKLKHLNSLNQQELKKLVYNTISEKTGQKRENNAGIALPNIILKPGVTFYHTHTHIQGISNLYVLCMNYKINIRQYEKAPLK